MSGHLAISVRQPWASLCVRGATKYVTRTRPPIESATGTRIAVYAARYPVTFDELDTRTRDAIDGVFGSTAWPRALPYAAIVGTVVLRGAYRMTAHDRRHLLAAFDRTVGDVPLSRVDRTLEVDLLGNYRPGLWVWLIEEPILFPTALRAFARRGWWTWHQPPTEGNQVGK
jgi:hypothetical protein